MPRSADVGDLVLAHLVGDYVLQSHWMATEKTAGWVPALAHGAAYTVPFLALTRSPKALLTIAGTHTVIDRFRLARHLAWAKNQLAPRGHRPTWDESTTGYPATTPPWLATGLLIVADNTAHLLIARAALR